MRSRVATFCFGLGLFVGGAASVGLLFGFEPSRLPPALLDIAAYKLAFIAALALLGVGAVVRRYELRARRAELEAAASHSGQLEPPDAANELERAMRTKGRDRVE